MSNNKKIVYADNAATTKLLPEALDSMMPYLKDEYGNPSSIYSFSRKSKNAIRDARTEIASVIGAKDSSEIIFTSCGSESDNMAIKGIAFQYLGQHKRIITSCIEHHAVLNACAFLEEIGFDVVYLPVDSTGHVKEEVLADFIDKNTILVSVMMVNNEIGTVQNIVKLAEIAHSFGAIFHTDAVQAVGHMPIDVESLGIDMLSASAHKFGGPKGIGFLYVRTGVKVKSLIHGGQQEQCLRAGTENVAGIVGMARAIRESSMKMGVYRRYLNELTAYFLNCLVNNGIAYKINGSGDKIPGNLNLVFPGFEGEMILHRLNLNGICVSTGSACNSISTDTSYVLKSIGLSQEEASCAVRFSFGWQNTKEDILYIVECLKRIIY